MSQKRQKELIAKNKKVYSVLKEYIEEDKLLLVDSIEFANRTGELNDLEYNKITCFIGNELYKFILGQKEDEPMMFEYYVGNLVIL